MLPNADNSQPGADSLRQAAHWMLDAHQSWEEARDALRDANNDLEVAQDHFMHQLALSGEYHEYLFFNSCDGELWLIHVDIEDGSVRSVVPALEVK